MNTTECYEYLANLKNKGQSEEVKEPSTPETKETTQEAPAEQVDDKVAEEDNKGVEQKQVEDKGDDKPEEPKAEVKEDTPEETPKQEPKKEEPQSKRDYAFERLKKKSREQKEKYEARIKELEAELEKGKGLKAEHFVKQDGTPDPNSYVDWKFKERNMQDEIRQLQMQERERQLQEDIEEDKRRVANCFQDEKERNDYNDLIARNGKSFYDAVTEVDPDGVVFGYLSTMPEYPVVLRELMTDSRLLGYTFRSTDPDTLKRNIAKVADDILERRHNSTPKVKEEPKVETPKVEAKKELPIVGKQINSTPSAGSTVHDRNYWNKYLKEHPRG